MRYNSLTTSIFIEKSDLVHNFKYDYSLVNYINSSSSVDIICPIHGTFKQLAQNHIKGCGCKLCGNDIQAQKKRGDTQILKINIQKIHGTNFQILNLDHYKNNSSKLELICLKHNCVFKQYAKHLLGGVFGCKKCCVKRNKNELFIENYLIQNNINFDIQKSFSDLKYKGKLFFDFYIPDKQLCIEFDGEQHFKSVKFFGGDIEFKNIQIRDKIKNKYCKENDINLYRISYKDNILEKLNEILIK